MIYLKRAYDAPSKNDGYRVLVDRMWPRGVSKEKAHIHSWLKEIAPSNELRKWFGHDPEKWEEFRNRYYRELENQSEVVEQLVRKAGEGTLTLVFAAKNKSFNNAVALKEYLEKRQSKE
ncbi:MAG: DUF488 domain-containing protein [Candidatus Jettenia sp. CY-1]|nr:MAG: DUF488 domain-containing protein [Candidatus Jettenia sp. CY-1]